MTSSHPRLRPPRVGAILVLFSVLSIGCTGPIYVEPDIASRAVQADFQIEIDPTHSALDTNMLVPLEEPVRISGESDELGLEVRVKRIPNRPGILWVEIFVENYRSESLGDVIYELGGVDRALYNLRENPYGEATGDREFLLGGIASRGVGRIHLGFDEAGGPFSFSLNFTGTTTSRSSSNSAPLVVTPDGAELWAVVPDADTVSVVDTATQTRVAELAMPEHPMGIATSTDGRLILVTSAHANIVSIIDRESREVVQQFGEEDGIGREPRHIVVTPDGSRALISAFVGDTLTVLLRRGDRYEVERNIPLGRRPSGISVTPSSGHAFVSHFRARGRTWENASWVSVIDLGTMELIREPEFRDVLNLDTAYCLADVFGASPQRFTADAARHALAGVYLDPAGNHGWIPHGVTGPFPVFERGPGSVDISPDFLPRPGEAVVGFLSVLDTHAPALATPLSNPGNVERPADPSYLACADFPLEIEAGINEPIPGSSNQKTDHFAGNPVAYTGLNAAGIQRFVAFTPGGRRALAISHITDTLMVVDAMTFHPTSQEHLILSGSNPMGIALSPDGRQAFVSYENSMFVSVLDLSALADPDVLPPPSFVPYEYREVPEVQGGQNGLSTERLVRHLDDVPALPPIIEAGTIDLVDEDPMDPVMRRGRTLFMSSNTEKHPQLSEVSMTACASCHVDGGTDGAMWATMEGERKTMGLWGGTRDRGWLHISATHRDIESFAELVVLERLGGELPTEDRDAMAQYIADGIPRLQGPVVDEALAEEGRVLFNQHCASCHFGDRMTSGMPDPEDPLGGGMEDGPILYDVGTAVDDARVALAPFLETILPPQEAELLRLCRGDRDLGEGDPLQSLLDFRQRPNRPRGQFKAPDLTNVWDHSLFLHDGRFDRIEDVVHYFVEELSLPIDEAGEAAIVEYLRTL